MEKVENCPVCQQGAFVPYLECVDYTVSHETFPINSCASCGFVFTNPRPEPKNLGKYYESPEYISHSNSSKGLMNKIYQTVRKYTVFKKIQLLNRLHPKANILDIGCGTGEFLHACKQNNFTVMGVEPDQKAREQGIKNYGLNISDESYISQIPAESKDIITMWHVLEHVPDLNRRMKELHNMLKIGGYAIIAVPNRSSYDAKYYQEFWAAYDVPRHLYHFVPKDINQLAQANGFKVKEIKPMIFDSLYVSLLSARYKKSSSIGALLVGLMSNLKAAAKNNHSYSSQIYILKK